MRVREDVDSVLLQGFVRNLDVGRETEGFWGLPVVGWGQAGDL